MEINKGKLVRWIDQKGFGFIKPENGGDDVFIHFSALKGMNRKPIIGDIIHYKVGFDASKGKSRAINARIEGVEQVLALEPLKYKEKKGYHTPRQKRIYRKPIKTKKPSKSFNFISICIVIGLAILIYSKASKEKKLINQVQSPTVETQEIEQEQQFQCNGKVWCSEMNSYQEAIFYLNNCPNTKMDGDGDGIPCERQF